jgi:hypothetical protein
MGFRSASRIENRITIILDISIGNKSLALTDIGYECRAAAVM